jgi:hypothetical protein
MPEQGGMQYEMKQVFAVNIADIQNVRTPLSKYVTYGSHVCKASFQRETHR